MNNQVSDAWQTICTILRRMDDEAVTRYESKKDGEFQAGLRQYHEHHRAVFGGRLGCEPAWSQRLAVLLRQGGIGAEVEYPYPPSAASVLGKSRASCDLRIDLRNGETLWIELKGSWPVCFARKNGRVEPYVWGTYSRFLHSDTGADFDKLRSLRRPDADWVGLVLIGFDTPLRRLDDDVNLLVKAKASDWTPLEPTEWDEPYYGTRARAWFWYSHVLH